MSTNPEPKEIEIVVDRRGLTIAVTLFSTIVLIIVMGICTRCILKSEAATQETQLGTQAMVTQVRTEIQNLYNKVETLQREIDLANALKEHPKLTGPLDPLFDMRVDPSDEPNWNSMVADYADNPIIERKVNQHLVDTTGQAMVTSNVPVYLGSEKCPDGQYRITLQMGEGPKTRHEIVHQIPGSPHNTIAGWATVGEKNEYMIFIYSADDEAIRYVEMFEATFGETDGKSGEPTTSGDKSQWQNLKLAFMDSDDSGTIVAAGAVMTDENDEPLILNGYPVHYGGVDTTHRQISVRYDSDIDLETGRSFAPIIEGLDVIPVSGGPQDKLAGQCKIGDRWIIILSATRAEVSYFTLPAAADSDTSESKTSNHGATNTHSTSKSDWQILSSEFENKLRVAKAGDPLLYENGDPITFLDSKVMFQKPDARIHGIVVAYYADAENEKFESPKHCVVDTVSGAPKDTISGIVTIGLRYDVFIAKATETELHYAVMAGPEDERIKRRLELVQNLLDDF